MALNATITCLNERRSVPRSQLAEPGPDHAALLRILQSAVRVPDHGKREPWRFLRIAGDARIALGEALARRTMEREPNASDAVLAKDRQRFTRAPVVVVVIAKLGQDEKIPESERFSSASCVCFAMLQAAQACGFGAQWLTGWPAYDEPVLRLLGLAAHERIAGFIHLGTPVQHVPERERPDPTALLADWHPA